MTVFETIKRRRSIGKMTEQRPTRTQIEQLLEAATHAPNHHKVEPWKFFVLAGKARQELGSIMAEALAARLHDVPADKAEAMLNKERNKPLRSPVLIVVAAEHAQQAKVLDIENIEAAAAATQNMLLAAEEMGLACMWRTGDAAYNQRVKQWLNLTPEDHIVGIVYVGFPAISATERHPAPVEAKTAWLGWQE
ncbi:nitroreductase [Ktedonosporobacter rubrisoli]|uniref:Putative NAD(P)H nitroreductase n=1 Tax=Ktedonosporobacter rubrisoli TaxID=2509675 RepID=A0A4P6JUQ4_KTERU|nr:nitroreductase [Ktedonosporobacter rubrisoli]QBD79073.1 nitroreductase [Ktedonosporobacter rubrisoli]